MSNDTVAILVIFAIIIIAILVMVLFGSQSNVSKLNGVGGRKNSEKDHGASLEVILVCGFLTVFLVTFLVIKKVRDRKRKARLKAEQMEKARKLEELKNAKERVRRAKMNEFLTAGESELEKRRREQAFLRNHKNQKNREGIQSSEEYRRRDLNEFRDELPRLDSYEHENFFKRLMHWIRNFFSRKTDRNL